MAFPNELPLSSVASTCRFVAETIPSVTDVAYSEPSGEPMASTDCPASALDESAKSATSLILFADTFNTAKSVCSSVPTNLAVNFVPSLNKTWIAFESETTWLFVTI